MPLAHWVPISYGKAHLESKLYFFHVSEQGERRAIIIPQSDHTPKADLTALQGVRPQAELTETCCVQLGLLAGGLLWFQTEGLIHARTAVLALLKILDTFLSLFICL